MIAMVVEGAIDEGPLRSHVAAPGHGAVVIFHGVVRDSNEGQVVEAIHYHGFREMAENELRAIADEVAARRGPVVIAIAHRVGTLAVGEASLVVAVGAPHRREAFEAALEVVDTLKVRVPIWKKEVGPAGERWVEGRRPEVPGGALPAEPAEGQRG